MISNKAFILLAFSNILYFPQVSQCFPKPQLNFNNVINQSQSRRNYSDKLFFNLNHAQENNFSGNIEFSGNIRPFNLVLKSERNQEFYKCQSNSNRKTKMRYDAEHQVCGEIGTKSHCTGRNMEFYSLDSTYGICDCAYNNIYNDNSPLVYHPQSKNCYFAFTRAYCNVGQWLVYNEIDQPICDLNPCYEDSNIYFKNFDKIQHLNQMANIKPKTVLYKGKCVELNKSSTNCPKPREILFHSEVLTPICHQPDLNTRHLSNINNSQCKPGSVRNIFGKCSRKRN